MAEQLDFEIIRERIKLLLERKNWTDYVLASHCGVPYATIWRFMNRRHKTIEYDNLVKIARAFDRVSSQLTGELPLDRSDAEIAVIKDAKIAGFFSFEYYAHVLTIGYACVILNSCRTHAAGNTRSGWHRLGEITP